MGKSSVQIPVRVDMPATEGELKEDELGSNSIERRRPMVRREDVELMGPTAGCQACHKPMMKGAAKQATVVCLTQRNADASTKVECPEMGTHGSVEHSAIEWVEMRR